MNVKTRLFGQRKSTFIARSIKRHVLSPMLFMALLLSACSGNSSSSGATSISDIYTSVASTLAATSNSAVPTVDSVDTSVPVQTSMPYPTIDTLPTAATAYSYSTPASCDSSAYLSDITISDGTELAPGEEFTKTWEFTNTGTCTWSKSYSIAFASGDLMDGSETEIDQSVSPGSTADISVDLTAPDTDGTYTGYWSLANESGVAFGQQVYVQIVVSEDAATSTPTATPTVFTSTPTAVPTQLTSTSTPTPITATATLPPTATPTVVPSDTPIASPTDTPSS